MGSKHDLPAFMLRSRLRFRLKPNNKLRPLSIVGRFAALVEKLVASRFDRLLLSDSHYSNRFGFLSGRNICQVQEKLNIDVWEANACDQKSAFIFLDLSAAYNYVNQQKMV